MGKVTFVQCNTSKEEVEQILERIKKIAEEIVLENLSKSKTL